MIRSLIGTTLPICSLDESAEQGLLALTGSEAKETVAVLSRQFLWFNSATLLLLLVLFHQSFRVHLGNALALEHAWISIVVYIVFTTMGSIALIAEFMRTP